MPKTEETTAEKPAAAPPTPKPIPMSPGYELSGTTALSITRAKLARVIMLAGPVGSGKTTLLSSIYELFGKGLIRGYSFAGSETLPVMELRCHLSRIASERAEADTERTKLDEALKLIHLHLADGNGKKTHLLMSDPSGEAFRIARDSTDECRKLTILRRADVVVFCLDGSGLSKRRTRPGIVADARALLRSMLDAGMLDGSSHAQVLFTKSDQLVNPEGETEAELTAEIERDFRANFESRLRRLEFRRTSVKPLASAAGIEELLASWVERDELAPLQIAPPLRESSRMYDCFPRSPAHGG